MLTFECSQVVYPKKPDWTSKCNDVFSLFRSLTRMGNSINASMALRKPAFTAVRDLSAWWAIAYPRIFSWGAGAGKWPSWQVPVFGRSLYAQRLVEIVAKIRNAVEMPFVTSTLHFCIIFSQDACPAWKQEWAAVIGPVVKVQGELFVHFTCH